VYTFTPSFDITLLHSTQTTLTVAIVEPTYGVTLLNKDPDTFPLLNCQSSQTADTTTCTTPLHLPSNTNIQSVQVVLEALADTPSATGRVLHKQKVNLQSPISYFHNTEMDAIAKQSGSSKEYAVAGSTIVGLSLGSANFLRMLKLMSFVEVMLYFDVDYPSIVEGMFGMFRDPSQVGFLTTLILGNSARSNVCSLPSVFVKRGHTSCSVFSRQLMFYLMVGLILLLKLFARLLSKYLPDSLGFLKRTATKVHDKLNFEYFYNYIDAYFFGISLESFISLFSAVDSYNNINYTLFYADKFIASFTILAEVILIFLGILFIHKSSNRIPSKSSKFPNTPKRQVKVNHKESKMTMILNSYDFTLKRNVRKDKFHGEYILPAIQLKSLLAGLIVVTLQSHRIIHVMFVTALQAGVIYFSLYRRNFSEWREWFVNITMHSGLLVCSLLAFALSLTSSSTTSPSAIYFSIGLPIVSLISIIFLINILNMLYSAVLPIIEYCNSNKSGKNKVQNATSDTNFKSARMVVESTDTPFLKSVLKDGSNSNDPIFNFLVSISTFGNRHDKQNSSTRGLPRKLKVSNLFLNQSVTRSLSQPKVPEVRQQENKTDQQISEPYDHQ